MNPELLKAVVDVNAVAEQLGIRVVLVGALMMEFTAEIRPDYPQPKRTNDADFAAFVKDWADFERLRGALEARKYQRDPRVEHRLTNAEKTVLLDLIPVGGGVAEDGKIVWPESKFEMTVIGFEEVCTAVATEVRAGLPKVPVITVPGFALLKIVAFQDRFEEQDLKYQNDVEHLAYWLEHYASIGEKDDRRFNFIERTGWRDLDINAAGAALLGAEVRKLCSAQARERVERFFTECIDLQSAFIETLLRLKRSAYSPEGLEKLRAEAVDWLKAFKRGYELGMTSGITTCRQARRRRNAARVRA